MLNLFSMYINHPTMPNILKQLSENATWSVDAYK